MTCKQCKTNSVWTFTNQIKLCRNCFSDYFERKVFRTIRKYRMLPKSRTIKLKKSKALNSKVLETVLKKKFFISFIADNKKPDFSSENLSEIAEKSFVNSINGKFDGEIPSKKPFIPLYFLSDPEINLYAKLNHIKGKKRKQNAKILVLFNKFLKKNPDLEHNIVNAIQQLKA